MSSKQILLAVLAGIVVLIIGIGIYFASTYNSLVTEKINVQTSQAQIETQLQRRADLIPNVVAATQGILNQEKEIFNNLADARSKYLNAQSGTPEKLSAGQAFDAATIKFLAVAESYPQLNSSQNVRDLVTELEGTENRVNVARQDYNEVVKTYNQKTQVFPTNVVAGMFNFPKFSFFESAPGSQDAPKVKLN
jgi:LemA protein